MNTNTQKKFLNPEAVLFQAGLKSGQVVADLGAGSGFYALASASIVGSQGEVHVVDVKESALDHVSVEARMRHYKNIKTYVCDLDKTDLHARLPEGQCDVAVLANILHEVQHPKNLLKHAYKLLKSGGKLVIIDWNSNHGPIGPSADKRVNEQEIKKTVESSSFRFIKQLDADEYHFAMVFER